MAETHSILTAGMNAQEADFISTHFLRSGYQVIAAADFAEARERLKAQKVDLAYIQASEQGNAVDKLEEIAALYPSLPLVLVCARSSETIILDALRAGATDILFTPLTTQGLDASIQRGARKKHSIESSEITPAAAHLVYVDDSGKECWATIDPPRFTIGRGLDNNLSLTRLGVSRSHAEVLIQNGAYLLRDVGSRAGTFLNGVQVKEAALTDGDSIQLGGSQGINLKFHIADILQS